jgi:flagellar hook-associated protein 2
MADPLSSVSGLSSGIDYRALVDQIIKAERRAADRMQLQIDANAKRKEALNAFQKALDELRTASDALRGGSAFGSFAVTATGADAAGRSLLSATAGAGAVPGSYQVKVLALAATQKTTASVGQASAGADLGYAGSFDLTRAGATVGSVSVLATDSLVEVRDKINALSATTKVQASIVSARADGSDQRLVLSATQGGLAGAFALSATGGTALADLGLAAPLQQGAADAQLEIDGVPVTRPTNSIGDAVPGVTFTLSAADPDATATVVVERQPAAAKDAAKAFVEKYNAVVAFMKAQGPASALSNEPLLRGMRVSLSGGVLAAGAGLPEDLATLGAVGISVNKDGTLKLDEAKWDAAYNGRFDELQATLADRMADVMAHVDTLAKPFSGLIDQRERALDERSGKLTDRITALDARLEKKRASLLAQYAKFEASLGRLQAIQSSLGTQLKGLTSSNDD